MMRDLVGLAGVAVRAFSSLPGVRFLCGTCDCIAALCRLVRRLRPGSDFGGTLGCRGCPRGRLLLLATFSSGCNNGASGPPVFRRHERPLQTQKHPSTLFTAILSNKSGNQSLLGNGGLNREGTQANKAHLMACVLAAQTFPRAPYPLVGPVAQVQQSIAFPPSLSADCQP